MTEVGAVIQAPRKSNGIELSYEQSAALAASAAPQMRAAQADPAEAELERLHQQLREVREWADSGEWRESGSDGLYAILAQAER